VLAKIGTKADTADFRDRMHQEQTASTLQVKQLMQLLKQLRQSESSEGPSAVVQRLATQFDREFKKFQQLNNSMDSKQVRVIDAVKEQNRKQSVAGSSGAFNAHAQYDEEDPLNSASQRIYDDGSQPSSQQQQLLSQEQTAELDIKFVQFEVAELEQRRVEIGRIEKDVLEVSEMSEHALRDTRRRLRETQPAGFPLPVFAHRACCGACVRVLPCVLRYRDLQELVQGQQEHIDQIDSAIVAARDRTEEGHKELVVAEEYQVKARKKQCCLLFIVLTVIAVVVVVVYLVK